MRASRQREPQTVFPWNTPVLLCAGSKRYSLIDLRSLVFGDANAIIFIRRVVPTVHKLLCENSHADRKEWSRRATLKRKQAAI
jgi:hypothetical protein